MTTISADIRKRIHQFVAESSKIDGIAYDKVTGIQWDAEDGVYIVSTWNGYHGYADEYILWAPSDAREQELSIAGFYGEN